MIAMRHLIPALLLLAAPHVLFAAEQTDTTPTTKTLVWPDGTRYVGGVVNDQRSGKGTIFWKDGTTFVGEFKNDMRNGPGTMTMPDGTAYNGVFEDDRLVRATQAPANVADTTGPDDVIPAAARTGGARDKAAAAETVVTLPPQQAGESGQMTSAAKSSAATSEPEATIVMPPVTASRGVDDRGVDDRGERRGVAQDSPADLASETAVDTTGSVVGDISGDVERQIKSAIDQWGRAWSDQNVPAYLASYSSEFEVPGNLSRRGWEALRRSRLTRPNRISLSIEYDSFSVVRPDVADIYFHQTYRSDLYSDVTRKRLRLQNEPGGWKIIQEKSL
jgi:hypothetical protein